MKCIPCNGTGRVGEDEKNSASCDRCDGTGRVPNPELRARKEE